MFPTISSAIASLSKPTWAGDRHTMSARSPYVGGIPSRAIGFPGIMFASWGVNSEVCLGPNPYHHSPKVINIPLDQISIPWNIEHVVCCLLSVCS